MRVPIACAYAAHHVWAGRRQARKNFAGFGENPQGGTKMLSTIAEIDDMVGAAPQFARDETITEVRRLTDVTALLQSIVDDMADAGMPVTMERPHQSCMIAGRMR
jgi:hypothetical protein